MRRWYVSDPCFSGYYLAHHGIKEQQWGVRRGPPYPLSRTSDGRINALKQENRKNRSTQSYGGLRLSKMTHYDGDDDVKVKRQLWDSMTKDLAEVNPVIKGEKYRDRNCVYCTLCYDLRRRGYDVYAPDKPEVTESEMLKYYKGFEGEYFLSDEDALKPQKPSPKRAKDIEKWANKELKAQGVGARGFFNVSFGTNIGHSMIYEVTRRGIVILDAQQNHTYRLNEITPVITDAGYWRTDDKIPNFPYLKKKGAYVNC